MTYNTKCNCKAMPSCIFDGEEVYSLQQYSDLGTIYGRSLFEGQARNN